MQMPNLPGRQRGIALFVGLILLLILTLVALSSSNVSIMQERMASNVIEYNLAFQRAEEALRDAELRVSRRQGLNIADLWQSHHGGAITDPNDCSLERTHGGAWDDAPWRDIGGDQFVMMVELNDYVNAAGLPTGSACRPAMAATRLDGTPIAGEYFVNVARGRGPGDAGRRAEVTLQSIFFWPD